MRLLTNNEKKLALLLSLALFLFANLIGWNVVSRGVRSLQTRRTRLRNEQLEAANWLAERDTWLARKKWLEAAQPRFKSAGEANTNLLETVQSSARRQNVAIYDQSFAEPVKREYYQEIVVKLRVSGTLEGISRWLAELQQPENFHAVTKFSLKSEAEPSKVKCDLQIARWYAPASAP